MLQDTQMGSSLDIPCINEILNLTCAEQKIKELYFTEFLSD